MPFEFLSFPKTDILAVFSVTLYYKKVSQRENIKECVTTSLKFHSSYISSFKFITKVPC